MWGMLCKNGKDLTVEFTPPKENKGVVNSEWRARYIFGKTGNKVLNIIQAEFEIKNGLIIKHTDHFSFSKWAGMALGLPGKLLGWTRFLKNKVRKDAASRLQHYMKS